MLTPKCFILQSLLLNILLEQSLVIHNRCSTGVLSHSGHESLGFIKPNLGWTPCCVIDRHIAVTLWPLLLSTGTARPFIYALVCVVYNCSELGVDAGWVWVEFLWLQIFDFNNQTICHQRAFSLILAEPSITRQADNVFWHREKYFRNWNQQVFDISAG